MPNGLCLGKLEAGEATQRHGAEPEKQSRLSGCTCGNCHSVAREPQPQVCEQRITRVTRGTLGPNVWVSWCKAAPRLPVPSLC